jgi:GT2 family glycosyltransferase
MKDLSVIIVSYKGWERLEKCLDSLRNFDRALFSFEVIVVDNSSDGTIREIEKRFPHFTFIQNPVNGGFGNGCNLGAQKAGSKFLLFLNPDTVVSEEAIGQLLKASMQNPDYYITSCRQVNERGRESKATGQFPGIWNLTGFQRSLAQIIRKKTPENPDDFTLPDWVSGSVMMIRRETFQMIRGFDEDFWMYYEDVDICRRVHDAGGKVAFFSNITIEHNHGGSSRINLQVTSITKTEVHISEHLYFSKSKSGLEKYLIQIFLVVNNLISGLILALSGLILFFIPPIVVLVMIFVRLISYYARALYYMTWVSTKSVNSVRSGHRL